MSSNLLSTKLNLPTVRPSLVLRTRLDEKLQAEAWRALTLVSAPPGFGKTTLVANWVRQSDLKTAWVSLDEGDNDLARFLSYLITALQGIEPSIGETMLAILQGSQSPSIEPILTAIINEVADVPDDFVLVLDFETIKLYFGVI